MIQGPPGFAGGPVHQPWRQYRAGKKAGALMAEEGQSVILDWKPTFPPSSIPIWRSQTAQPPGDCFAKIQALWRGFRVKDSRTVQIIFVQPVKGRFLTLEDLHDFTFFETLEDAEWHASLMQYQHDNEREEIK